jgi:hypothetical protein
MSDVDPRALESATPLVLPDLPIFRRTYALQSHFTAACDNQPFCLALPVPSMETR